MKAAHSQQSELDVISVFVGTWNMGINIQYIISHEKYYGLKYKDILLLYLYFACRGQSTTCFIADLGYLLWSGSHPR